MILPVILAGGTGSRLWPVSRELYPKQFLKVNSKYSMLQDTILRLKEINAECPIVICNEEHRFLAAEQLREIGQLNNNIILESKGKNTAPAITLAALHAKKYYENPVLLILAADHYIPDEKKFIDTVKNSVDLALQGGLVTFGIVPTKPETGYGYIKRGTQASKVGASGYIVEKFIEKPPYEKAKEYYLSGDYFWNSGMFLFTLNAFLSELEHFRSDILSLCEQSIRDSEELEDLDFIRINDKFFSQCPDISIDYALMEHTKNSIVVPLDVGWNDVGSWSALWEVMKKDDNGNVLTGDIFSLKTNNAMVMSEDRFVATIGVQDLVIIDTKDALLVINKKQVQDVKDVVGFLKSTNRREYREHRESYKNWGKSDKIVDTERYHVNRLAIKPGNFIDSQKHFHRTEHWIILSGTAEVTLNGVKSLLTKNQSIFVPIGTVHKISNPGKIDLELLEVQAGDYLAGDDILRIKE